MMGFTPKDIIAFGLLVFIMLYLIFVFTMGLRGQVQADNAGIREKEIIIYIVGVLSGYIGNNININRNNGNN